MNKKQDIIKEVEHYINGKYNLGITDDKIVKDCINKTLEAINYTFCCTEFFCEDEDLGYQTEKCANQCEDCSFIEKKVAK